MHVCGTRSNGFRTFPFMTNLYKNRAVCVYCENLRSYRSSGMPMTCDDSGSSHFVQEVRRSFCLLYCFGYHGNSRQQLHRLDHHHQLLMVATNTCTVSPRRIRQLFARINYAIHVVFVLPRLGILLAVSHSLEGWFSDAV